MHTDRLDDIRGGVLRQMERAERNMKLGIFGAALIELLLFILAFTQFDLKNPVERIVFITSVLGYTITVLGLVALGAHVTRSVGRIVALLDRGDQTR